MRYCTSTYLPLPSPYLSLPLSLCINVQNQTDSSRQLINSCLISVSVSVFMFYSMTERELNKHSISDCVFRTVTCVKEKLLNIQLM